MDRVRDLEIQNLIQKGKYLEAIKAIEKKHGVKMSIDEVKHVETKAGRSLIKTIAGKIFVIED